MRTLALLLMVAGCSTEDEIPGLAGADSAITVVTLDCDEADLRIYAGDDFTGTRLCLRGTGTYDNLHSYFPNGIGSVKAGQYRANFYTILTKGYNVEACTNHSHVSSIIQTAAHVTRLSSGAADLAGSSGHARCP